VFVEKLSTFAQATNYRWELKRNQWKSRQEVHKVTLMRAKSILKYAFDYIPYYHRIFLSAGIKPDQIHRLDDFSKIPATTKQDIQSNYDDITPNGVDVSRLPRPSFTSGSTGNPLRVIWDVPALSFNHGATMYAFFECGVKPGDNFVTIWGRAQEISRLMPYVRLLGGIRETIIPLFPQEQLVKVLRKLKPDVILTFPSILSSLANYDTTGITPRLIFTQGEMVTPHVRELVRDMFHLELFETYGSVEFGLLAFECQAHNGLHMITTGNYLELTDGKGDYVAEGEKGEVSITSLCNRAMPMIRYRLGDEAVASANECSCGRSWPLLRNIQGRTNDYIILPSGRRISWLHFYHQFYKELERDVLSISQYQIIQERKDEIIFKIVKGQHYDQKILDRMKSNMKSYFAELGDPIEVTMEVVKEIPKERTGKRRMLISKLS
jgi:phenylacetate-CoA ligase